MKRILIAFNDITDNLDLRNVHETFFEDGFLNIVQGVGDIIATTKIPRERILQIVEEVKRDERW